MMLRLVFAAMRWTAFLLLVAVAGHLEASIQVALASSPASPQPVATTITWTATISDTASGGHEYQYSVAANGGPAAVVREYHPVTSFPWTPSKTEGTYTISVIARNLSTGQTASANASFTITSRLANGHAAVNSTSHPLVALFSAPACQIPNLMRVRFTPRSVPAGGISAAMTTNSRPMPRGYNVQNARHDEYELLYCGHVLQHHLQNALGNRDSGGRTSVHWY